VHNGSAKPAEEGIEVNLSPLSSRLPQAACVIVKQAAIYALSHCYRIGFVDFILSGDFSPEGREAWWRTCRANLRPGEARFLTELQQSGNDGVIWTKDNSGSAQRLLRMGLIGCRFGILEETKDGGAPACDS
jgi:hypothetical protein